MVRPVDQAHGDIDHGKAERARMEVIADADLDRRNVVLRHHAAGDLVAELEARAALTRLDRDHDVAKLTVTAGLLLVAPAHFRSEEHTSELQSLRHLVCRL